eukprot:Plantae.Rhodophyta-Purpureofilum_apyrenoidigerum.ctg5884.p1 GENE.Plantae.Rhodophyta-Purpureofilum_apyrenoidigerum.ctg5884~~Plantae.Rhodophyta-Purpureofilum_apyrenoidigerum.ctg5884.p1  ORF type:complete len:373 (+),score=85.94 Plantae.Rhodophyta-Purpureofilum_apyrenoidigerum.ctg5884:92-1210(+)
MNRADLRVVSAPVNGLTRDPSGSFSGSSRREESSAEYVDFANVDSLAEEVVSQEIQGDASFVDDFGGLEFGDAEMSDVKERTLRKTYEENVDGVITDLEKGNYFLGYDKVPDKDEFLADKRVLKKFKVSLGPYGQSWEEDIFTLGHNAIKQEMQDMFHIVRAMEKLGLKIRRADVSLFYQWWRLFLSLFTFIMDMQEDVYMPWIEKRIDLSGTGWTKTERNAMKKKMLELLNVIRTHEAKMSYIPAGEVAPKLISFLNNFNPLVLKYMSRAEQNVAPRIAAACTETEYRKELLPFAYRYLHGYSEWTEIGPLLTSWMDKAQAAHWKKQFLGTSEKLRFAIWCRQASRTHYELRDMIIEHRAARKIMYRSSSR